MRAHALPLLAAALLPLSACIGTTPQQYEVIDLRILAIRDRVVPAAPISLADAEPTDSVELTALVANPSGGATTVDWYACPPPLSSPPPSCLDGQALARPSDFPGRPDVTPLGSGLAVTVDLSSPAVAPLAASVGAAIGALIAATGGTPELACSLFVDLPVVAIARSGGAVQVAVKRVRIVPPPAALLLLPPELQGAYVRNLNPVLESLLANPSDRDACGVSGASPGGGPVTTSLPGSPVTLCVHPSDSSTQVPNLCRAGGVSPAPAEDLEAQWYVSAGTIAGADFDGNATGAWVELTPPAGSFTLWVILRDGRGGTDWLELTF
jgi:hypothetical protein